MLKSIDVLIGLTVVMLALSMAVTVVTQVITTVLNSRGRHLKAGVISLLNEIDPRLTGQIADAIATSVLKHPLIHGARGRLGSVIQREELTKLLLDLGAGRGTLAADARGALRAALEANGIEHPGDTLKDIRELALQLETASPTMASDVRQAIAIVRKAESDLVAKVHASFDQTMDRVAARFTAYAHAITFVVAILLAAALQVDTIGLINRFSTDDALRQAFVAQGKAMQQAGAPQASAPQASNPAAAYPAFLGKYGVISVATTPDEWWDHWAAVNVFGVLVTGLLVSLGAPFWYKALGNLLQLRSRLAIKDDAARDARQGAETVRAPARAGEPLST
jgi:hypothetical protein